MNIENNYEQHVEVAKKLKMSDSFYEVRQPHQEAFEKIYNQAKEEKVTISNAKEFLDSLSKDELKTLQNYTLLADDVNVNSLSDEGAYNLLLHHYEKYDFDNDGFVSTGIGKNLTLLPEDMPINEKEALVETLNEMNEKDRFLSLLLVNLPTNSFDLNNGTISVKQDNTPITYESIMQRVENILNPTPPAYSSPEIKNTFNIFKELFEKNFSSLNEQNEQYKSSRNNETNVMKARLLSE